MKPIYRLTAVLLVLILPLQAMAALSTVAGMTSAGCRMLAAPAARVAVVQTAAALSVAEHVGHGMTDHAMTDHGVAEHGVAEPKQPAVDDHSCCPADASASQAHLCEISAACGLLLSVMLSAGELRLLASAVPVDLLRLSVHHLPFHPANAIWRPPAYS